MDNNVNKLVNEKEGEVGETFVNQVSSPIIDEMLNDNTKIENYISVLNNSPYFWRNDLNEQLQLLNLGITDARTYGDWQDDGKQVARRQKSVGKVYTLNNIVKYMFNEDQCYSLKNYDENIKSLFKGDVVYNEDEYKNITKEVLIEKLNNVRNEVFNNNKETLDKYIRNQVFDYKSITEEFTDKYYLASEKSNNLSYKDKEKVYIDIYDKAPFSLRVVGINSNSKIRISLNAIEHIDKHFGKEEKDEIMKSLPDMIANPTIILKGNKKDSLVLLSNINVNNKNILIPLHYNKDNESVDIYSVASLYERSNVEFYIEKEILNHNVLAYNTKKVENYRDPYDRLLLPKGDVISTYDDSILHNTKNVKPFKIDFNENIYYEFDTDNKYFKPTFKANFTELEQACKELNLLGATNYFSIPDMNIQKDKYEFIGIEQYYKDELGKIREKLIENRTKQLDDVKNYYRSIGKYTEYTKIEQKSSEDQVENTADKDQVKNIVAENQVKNSIADNQVDNTTDKQQVENNVDESKSNPKENINTNKTINKVLKGNVINDFGERIGGAKKDLWKDNGISINELKNMNAKEQEKYVIKSNIWIKPDYNELIKNGTPKEVVYFYKTVIDATPVSIEHSVKASEDAIRSDNERYINFINKLKDLTYSCKTIEDCKNFKNVFRNEFLETHSSYVYYPKEEYRNIIKDKLVRTIDRWNWKTNGMISEMVKKGFGEDKDEFNFNKRFTTFELDGIRNRIIENNRGSYSLIFSSNQGIHSLINLSVDTYNEISKYKYIGYDSNNHKFYGSDNRDELFKNLRDLYNETKDEGVKSSKCKKKYKYMPLEDIKRTGSEDYLNRDANSEDFLNVFKFKGGEFGNWVNDSERQKNLNFSYNSFKDIAKALDIRDEDVSFNGKLSIAFGSRGSGSALAHYEPMRKVINLTKMKGAGALAHEYGHFLDNIICEAANGENSKTTFGSEVCNSFGASFEGKKELKDAFKNLVSCMTKKLANEKEKEEYREKELNVIKNTNLLNHYNNRYSDFYLFKKLENCFNTDYKTSLNMFNDIISDCKEIVSNKSDNEKLVRFASNISCNKSFIENTLRRYYQLKDNPLDNLMIDTDYYKLSKEVDETFSKSGFGYWSSNCEMFARAFSCYVNDTLKNNYGITNNYLTGYCEVVAPIGEERKKINTCFDKLIAAAKKCNLLHLGLESANKLTNTKTENINENTQKVSVLKQ